MTPLMSRPPNTATSRMSAWCPASHSLPYAHSLVKLERAGDVPVQGGASPAQDTPEDLAKAQQQLAALQWVIPA
jgi:hypothetical protein